MFVTFLVVFKFQKMLGRIANREEPDQTASSEVFV